MKVLSVVALRKGVVVVVSTVVLYVLSVDFSVDVFGVVLSCSVVAVI